MIISIDFDDTYSVNPQMWDEFIRLAWSFDFHVICVTARHDYEMAKVHSSIGNMIGKSQCFSTGRVHKKKYMKEQGLKVDIWIDDNPSAIVDPNWMMLSSP
jgi:hypothetical protein